MATVSFLLLAPFGAVVIDQRLRALAKSAAAAPDGPLPASLAARAQDPLVGIGLSVYPAMLLGIVFLMTNKPPLDGSIATMLVAALLGLLSSAPLWRHARRRSERPA